MGDDSAETLALGFQSVFPLRGAELDVAQSVILRCHPARLSKCRRREFFREYRRVLAKAVERERSGFARRRCFSRTSAAQARDTLFDLVIKSPPFAVVVPFSLDNICSSTLFLPICSHSSGRRNDPLRTSAELSSVRSATASPSSSATETLSSSVEMTVAATSSR